MNTCSIVNCVSYANGHRIANMDYIVDQYFSIIDFQAEELNKLEDEIFEKKYNKETIEKIYTLKKRRVEIKRVSFPLIDIYNRLMRFDTDNLIHDDIKLYLRDVYDYSIPGQTK